MLNSPNLELAGQLLRLPKTLPSGSVTDSRGSEPHWNGFLDGLGTEFFFLGGFSDGRPTFHTRLFGILIALTAPVVPSEATIKSGLTTMPT